MRARRGFTLWEMTIVFALVAISVAIVIPSWTEDAPPPPPLPGDALVTLLRDARRVAMERSQTVAVRIDPASGYYQVDTTGAMGTGFLVDGTLSIGSSEALVTDRPRLQYLFRPSGAALADTVLVRGEYSVLVAVDAWSGQAVRYAR